MAENVRPTGKAAVIAALAAGQLASDAAEAGAVSTRTVSRWRADAAFQDEVTRARREMLDRASGTLAAAAVEAVATLREMLDAEHEAVRVRAAKEILASLLAIREHGDIEERVRKLEEKQSGAAS